MNQLSSQKVKRKKYLAFLFQKLHRLLLTVLEWLELMNSENPDDSRQVVLKLICIDYDL